ncbi:hypothetical protein SASPL_152112 [Salvia splendens]|uniref:Uncharacterized protein n=1 Tax=Salvia splendens TaxID=180675 RepID=A0A8X8W2I7_SALSN|nr:hypothetical protein SASPL_152112 [Salvia splendens]
MEKSMRTNGGSQAGFGNQGTGRDRLEVRQCFRSGYLQKLEDSLRQEFPRSDLKANPHIQSKIHIWKKSYGALSLVLARSGADNSARLLRNKAWPLYNDWKIVFGKNRATGDKGRDTGNIPNEFGSGPPSTNPGRESPLTVSHEDLFGEDPRAYNEPPNAAGENAHDTNARLEHLASRIGYEFDVEKAQKQLFELIGVIHRLTLGQVFDASDVILEKIERLNYFMSLPPRAREAYCFFTLDRDTEVDKCDINQTKVTTVSLCKFVVSHEPRPTLGDANLVIVLGYLDLPDLLVNHEKNDAL